VRYIVLIMPASSATATVTIEFPVEVFSALRRSPDQFAVELRLAAAIHWYSRREISMEKAALIAGLNRRDFMMELGRRQVDVFQIDQDELRRELAGG
jgi:predicted HTH domain antitoxin